MMQMSSQSARTKLDQQHLCHLRYHFAVSMITKDYDHRLSVAVNGATQISVPFFNPSEYKTRAATYQFGLTLNYDDRVKLMCNGQTDDFEITQSQPLTWFGELISPET